MFRHAAILVAATASALASAQGLVSLADARATPTQAARDELVLRESGVAGSAAQIVKAKDGHYWAEADVDGRHVRFLVDTGASAVALTGTDAKRLGIDLETLVFDRPVITAAGEAMAASVTLGHVAVAGARVEDVSALVVRDGLQSSLLGMSYLGRLARFEATRTALILRP